MIFTSLFVAILNGLCLDISFCSKTADYQIRLELKRSTTKTSNISLEHIPVNTVKFLSCGKISRRKVAHPLSKWRAHHRYML